MKNKVLAMFLILTILKGSLFAIVYAILAANLFFPFDFFFKVASSSITTDGTIKS